MGFSEGLREPMTPVEDGDDDDDDDSGDADDERTKASVGDNRLVSHFLCELATSLRLDNFTTRSFYSSTISGLQLTSA
ncbi:hypothetical protein F0562_001879 [Nyssa sinensis]|uniref:Uncharacterized protein n=1 Tax=Nyssa sinensis TaxID=561372 RepID=A0A5J5C4F0_9ASTE|nr:hypothetical protein F0562_001879 [Nyssa sinensis]